MKDRITKFLRVENISSSKFADEIGVQRSSISHIIAGRNNPSLELIQKMLNRFDKINPDWLILGKGEMYRTVKNPTLFDHVIVENKDNNKTLKTETKQQSFKNEQKVDSKSDNSDNTNEIQKITHAENRVVEKMMIIYSDGTFKTYSPAV